MRRRRQKGMPSLLADEVGRLLLVTTQTQTVRDGR